MAGQLDPVRGYEQALRALLAALENPGLPAPALAACAERCAEAFERLEHAPPSGDALERSAGLLAVLRQACARERALAAGRLELARAVRRAFALQASADSGGAACDCAG